MLVLGTLTLDEDPYVSISYEYSQTSNGQIIGGTKKITLTGTIIENSTSALITKANEISDWFAQSDNRYINNVIINSQTYPFVLIDSVSVESEDWVSNITYTIVLVAQIEASAILPSNILSLEYNDYITSLDIAESMTLSADKSNTYIFVGANSNPPAGDPQLDTIEESLTWEMKISLTCRRSSSSSAIQNAHNILNEILITTPDRAEFDEYKDWTIYLQNRSLDSNPTAGSLSFSCKVLLIPPEITTLALVNIQGAKNHNYISNSHSATVNLKTTGLVPIDWSSIITLSDYYITNKIVNAQSVMNTLIDYYKNITTFPSQDLIPVLASCDPVPCTVITDNICYIPKNINTTKNMTDGTMTATIEWSADNNVCNNGLLVEIEKTVKTTDSSIVEQSNFNIALPIIINMNCRKAIVESWNINVTSKLNCIDNTVRTEAVQQYTNIVNHYTNRNTILNNPTSFFEVQKRLQQNNNSCNITVDFVQKCLFEDYYANN